MAGAGSLWAPQLTLRRSPDYLSKGPSVPQSHPPPTVPITATQTEETGRNPPVNQKEKPGHHKSVGH